jgi:hypothetical protein
MDDPLHELEKKLERLVPHGLSDQGRNRLEEMERLEYRREFGDPEDHRIVVTRFNEPMHSWNYKVREVELILDPVTGLRVELVTEHEEEVRTAVTSF